MSIQFDYAINWLKEIEGGYVNDPDDRGGETKYGISKRSYPDLDIANLTRPQARVIYRDDYWIGALCDQMPSHYAWTCFDGAVIHGPNTSVKFIQGAIGVAADGIYGPVTHKAIWQVDNQWRSVLKRIPEWQRSLPAQDAVP